MILFSVFVSSMVIPGGPNCPGGPDLPGGPGCPDGPDGPLVPGRPGGPTRQVNVYHNIRY